MTSQKHAKDLLEALTANGSKHRETAWAAFGPALQGLALEDLREIGGTVQRLCAAQGVVLVSHPEGLGHALDAVLDEFKRRDALGQL